MNEIVFKNIGIPYTYTASDDTMAYWKLNGDSLDSSNKGYNCFTTGLTFTNNSEISIFEECGIFNTGVTTISTLDSGFTSSITISVWVNVQTGSATAPVVGNRVILAASQSTGILFVNTGAFRFNMMYNGSTEGKTILSTVNTSLLNKWIHLCLTYDGSLLRAYINGLEISQSPVVYSNTISLTGTSSGFSLGYDNTPRRLTGFIDEVIIEKNVWTSDKIRRYFYSGLYPYYGNIGLNASEIVYLI